MMIYDKRKKKVHQYSLAHFNVKPGTTIHTVQYQPFGMNMTNTEIITS